MAGQQDTIMTVGGDFTPIIQQSGPAAAQVQRAFSSVNFNTNGLKDYGNGLGVISRRASEFERSLASANSRVFAFGIAAGQIYLVAKALDSLVKSTIDVQKELTDINVILNLSQGQLGKFSSSLFSIANLTGQSFKTVSETALQFSRQGLGVSEVLKRTADSMNLVRIGGLDLDTSIKAITATLNTFNEVGLDSTALLNRIAAVDSKFAVSGNVIATALLKVGSVASEANISLNETIGMITALQQRSARGGDIIGTSMATIFQRVQRPQVLEQLQQMGVATENLSGESLNAAQVLTNLAKVYDRLSESQKSAVTMSVSGMRNANQFKALIADLGSNNSITGRATNTAGEASDQATRRQLALNQTLAAQFNTVKNNLTKLSSDIGNISLAPALQNIFKGINLISTESGAGSVLGQGILKGLGNYLSGPGLALAGVLAARFFGQFGQFAVKSLATIIEQGSAKQKLQAAVNLELEKETGLRDKIVAVQNSSISAAQKELQIQTLINQSILERNSIANIKTSAAQSVASMIGSIPLIGSSEKAYTLGGQGEILANPKHPIFADASRISSVALSDAIAREQKTGINISQIKVGSSPVLMSPTNPIGIGIYNTVDEPGGLNQGIQRVIAQGKDPKQAGIIPSFAETSVYTKTTYAGNEKTLTLGESAALEDRINKLKSQIEQGVIGFSQLGKSVLSLDKGINLTEESFSAIKARLTQTAIYYKAPQIGFSSNEEKELAIKNALAQVQSFNASLPPPSLSGPQRPDEDILVKLNQQNQLRNTELVQSQANKLNVLDATIGRLLPNSRYNAVSKNAKTYNTPDTLNKANQRLAGQGLMVSFLAPMAAGIAQKGFENTFGQDSTSTRGSSALIGAAGNIASFTMGGLAFGAPEIGAALGVLTSLPSVFKAFNDTLPDLQRNLDKLKDSSQKTNDAFTTYIQTSQKLFDLNTPGNSERGSTSVFQYNQLVRQQQDAGFSIPAKFRSQISSAISKNDFSKAYDIFSVAQLNNSQDINLNSDTSVMSKYKGLFSKLTALPQMSNVEKQYLLGGSSDLNRFENGGAIPAQKIIDNIISSSSNIGRPLDLIHAFQRAGIPINGLNGQLKDQSTTAADAFNAIRSNLDTNTTQPINELLGLTNDNGEELSSLLHKDNKDISNPADFKKYLLDHNFDSQKTTDAGKFLESYESLDKSNIDIFKNSTSKEEIDKLIAGRQMLQEENDKTAKIYNDMNERLAKLSNTGAEAVTSFEENVINKLSQSLTKLKLQGISDETTSRIAEINSGKNDYNKTYFDYTRQNQSSNNQYNQEVENTNQSSVREIGSLFTKQTNDFIIDLRKKASASGKSPVNTEQLINGREDDLNKIFAGYSSIGEDGTRKISSDNLDTNGISIIKDRLAKQIKDYNSYSQTFGRNDFNTAAGYLSENSGNLGEEISKRYNGSDESQSKEALGLSRKISQLPAEDQKNLLSVTFGKSADTYGEWISHLEDAATQDLTLLNSLNDKTSETSVKLAEIKANWESNSQTQFKQLIDNYKILGAQFTSDETNSLSANKTNIQFSSKAFDLSREASISNPVDAINYNAQAQLLQQKGGFINELRTSTGSDFGLGINSGLGDIGTQKDKWIGIAKNLQDNQNNGVMVNQKDLKDAVSTADALTKIYDQLTIAQQNNAEEVRKNIDSISSFTDVQSNFTKQRNINRADQGVLTGSDYARAALAPLQYNSQTFNRDAITGLQEFSEVLKTDLSDGLMNAIHGAKTASEAFRNLGLSLAENLAAKATNIGINSLFGVITSGAKGLFNESHGGYIPRFATGGFVNMGSGTKDDVPAFLSGGEFVLNRNAVSKIGKGNLDSLNSVGKYAGGGIISNNPTWDNYDPGYFTQNLPAGAITSDSLSISPTSAKIGLANSYSVAINNNGQATGSFNTSSLLSGIGLSSQDNPQNRLKAAREKYVYGNSLSQIDYQKQLNAYNTSQDFMLGQAYLGAIGSIAGGAFSAYGNSHISAGQNAAMQSEFYTGTSDNLNGGTSSSGLSWQNYGSIFNKSLDTGFNIGKSSYGNAHGGYIPKLASGGYFGGDSSSDKFKAMVMGGEYVVSPKTVSKYGVNYFKGLNNTAKYSAGGYVPSSSSSGGNDISQIIGVLQQISDKIGGTNSSITNTISKPNQQTGNNQTAPVINVTTNITMPATPNGQATSQTTTSSAGGNNNSINQDSLKKFTDQVNGQIINTITSQSRPGGLLYQTFQTRTS